MPRLRRKRRDRSRTFRVLLGQTRGVLVALSCSCQGDRECILQKCQLDRRLGTVVMVACADTGFRPGRNLRIVRLS